MKNHKMLFGVAVLALLGATTSHVLAKSVCYELPGGIMRLDVNFHSKLTSKKERRNFGHPIQKAYSVHGMRVFDDPDDIDDNKFTYTSTGTVLVAPGVGARMGLMQPTLIVLGFDGASLDVFDCNAEEPSALPDEWKCVVTDLVADGSGSGLHALVLKRIEEADNGLCSTFVLPDARDDPPE